MSEDPWSAALIEQNRRWLTAYFHVGTGNRTVAEDLEQDTFHAALANHASFDPSRPLGAWLRGIARHRLLKYYRTTSRQPLFVDADMLDELDNEGAVVEKQQVDPGRNPPRLRALRDCIASMTERVRQMLEWRYQEAVSSKDIAERLTMKATAVDMALSRARRALESCMQRRLGGVIDE